MISKDQQNKCPHCGVFVRFENARPRNYGALSRPAWSTTNLGVQGEGHAIDISSASCPSCNEPILTMNVTVNGDSTIRTIYPFHSFRYVPPEVPPHIKEDFDEALAVLPLSTKASAALSRRCLQNMLIDKGAPSGVRVTLSQQIDWAITSLPDELKKQIDYIRIVGNFAAHPIKDTNTGEIVEVEEGEAEWNLTVLEQLFEQYYVLPAKRQAMIDEMNKKLNAAGKRPLKK